MIVLTFIRSASPFALKQNLLYSIILTLLSLYMIYYVLQYIYTHVFNYINTYIHLRLIFAFLAERLEEKGFSDTNKKV